MKKAIFICNELNSSLVDKTEGIVFSVFVRAFNILMDDGLIVSILQKGLPIQPYSIVMDYRENFNNLVRNGSRVKIEDNKIYIDGYPMVDLIGADKWTNTLEFEYKLLDEKNVEKRIQEIPKIIFNNASFRGISPVISCLCEYSFFPPNTYSTFIAGYVTDFLNSIIENEESISCCAERLIGFGPGLTPSGDDFLSGAMLANLYYHKFKGENLQKYILVNKEIVKNISSKTNIISGNMLLLSSEGKVSSLFHKGIKSIFMDIEEEDFKKNIKKIMEYGATSGEDFLSGLYCMLITLINKKI